MVKSVIHNISIRGISVVVPKKERSLLDDPTLYNGNEKKIKRVIESSGFLKRRVADEDVLSSDLCLQAAEDVISQLNIEKKSIDALLFVSYTPDYLMPATSYVLHKKLSLSENCIVMDIPQACSGYILGLYQAGMLLNNGCKRVLLLVGDTFSKFSDMFINHSAPIFGDAGSATIIDFKQNSKETYFNIQSDGNGYDALMCKNGGFRHKPEKASFYENNQFQYCAKMEGGRIFDFAINKIYPNILENLTSACKNISDIDFVILHQANKMIMKDIASKLNIPFEKVPTNTLTEYGNQCGTSIPSTICHAIAEKVKQTSQQVILCGFGAGLSWASVLLELGPIYCSKIINYKGEKNDKK